jgi:hypothetical protein
MKEPGRPGRCDNTNPALSTQKPLEGFRMASRYAITFLLACVSCFAGSVRYYPVNVHHSATGEDIDGFTFYFERPTADQALVTIEIGGVPHSQSVDTDRHGDHVVFLLKVDPKDRHDLTRVTINIGGAVYTVEHMQSGALYELDAKRTHQ